MQWWRAALVWAAAAGGRRFRSLARETTVVAPRQILCKLSELKVDEGKEVFLVPGAARSLLLLLRVPARSTGDAAATAAVAAYVNKCPHVGVPLNMFPDLFLTRDKQHILCCAHGALFRKQDGLCIDVSGLRACVRPCVRACIQWVTRVKHS